VLLQLIRNKVKPGFLDRAADLDVLDSR